MTGRRECLHDAPGSPRRTWLAVAAVVLGLLAATPGCTRRWFRNKADQEAADVIAEKDRYALWKLQNWHVYPDPRARFADPTNPDRPPMPPDDPASRDMAPNPQKPKNGVARVGGTGYLELLAQYDAINRAASAARQAREREQAAGDGTGTENPVKPAGYTEPGGAAGVVAAALRDSQAEPGGQAAPAGDKERPAGPERLPEPEPSPGGEKKDQAAAEEKEPPGLGPGTDPLRLRGFVITLEQAVELGLINSREYQTRREDLYLAALPVTAERFAFATQWFATEQIIRSWIGRELQPETAGGESRNNWTFVSPPGGGVGFTKAFPTGALLLVRFANRTVVNLTGNFPHHTLSNSTVDLDLVQPLLRGGGRAVALEPLTEFERNLLYEMRDYAHFRKEFYTAVATGGLFSGGGAFTSGTAATLAIAPPVGGGVPTPVELNLRINTAPGISGRVGTGIGNRLGIIGYLQVLQAKWQLQNERENLDLLTFFEDRFRTQLFFSEELQRLGYYPGLIGPTQYNQVRQSRLSSQANVYQLYVTYRTNLDLFKLNLGVPTDVEIDLDDGPLRPVLEQVTAYENHFGFRRLRQTRGEPPSVALADRADREARRDLEGLRPDPPEKLRPSVREAVEKAKSLEDSPFRQEFLDLWEAWSKITDPAAFDKRLSQLRAVRRDLLDQRSRLILAEKAAPPELLQRLRELDLEVAIGELVEDLALYASQPWKGKGTPEEQKLEQERQYEQIRSQMLVFLVAARLEVLNRPREARIREIRRSWPELPPVCVGGVDLIAAEEETALQAAGRTALENRFELMNVRGQLVDSWRRIAVAANQLLGTFNVEYHIGSATTATQPFNFSRGRTRHDVVLNTELPLVRLLERNAYRATLIAYQRQRRTLMEAEDHVLAFVRAETRQLRNLARNYNEVQKGYLNNIDLAYTQADLSGEFIFAPQKPNPATALGLVGPPTAAEGGTGDPIAATQQFLGALSSLLRAKNDLYRVWIEYNARRIELYRDLEVMPLDGRGVWIDDPSCLCPPGRLADGTGSQPTDGGNNPPTPAEERGTLQLPAPQPLPDDLKPAPAGGNR